MHRARSCWLITVVLIALAFNVRAPDENLARASDPPKNVPPPIRILLLGDSTCIGSVCRVVAPHADHLEQIIEKLLAAEGDLPPVKVINKGLDGQWIGQLFDSGFYEREVTPLKNLDYVLVRYGANDRARLKDFPREFPRDCRRLLERLRKDQPRAKLVLMTMLPVIGAERGKEVNDIVRSVAAEQKVPLLDTEKRFAAELKSGVNMLNYRRMALKDIPARYHALLTNFIVGDYVVVLDNTLDAHLAGVPGWFRDRHPNLAGYHVIGDETAKFLAPMIRERLKSNPLTGRLDRSNGPLLLSARISPSLPGLAMSAVRTRFAPSPTGYMHIGGMRTALFNWLWARHTGGQFILRIDDTDRERNIDEALRPILHAFRWLGLDWDEGPEVGGPHGPYFQSQRTDLYRRAAERLLAENKAYRDFEKPEEVQRQREAAEREKRPFLSSRRSLELSAAEIDRLVAAGQPHVLRFLVPRDQTIVLDDAIRGRVEWNTSLLADPVIQRTDGSALYNFATVVDDADLRITHVIRAEEHLSNTPVQILLHQALGNELPVFAHIPVVTAPGTTKKLSKREIKKYRENPKFRKMFEAADRVFPQIGLGSPETLNPVMVEYYEQIGYLPAAVLNALARLGWSLDDRTEIMSLETIIENFTLDRVVKNPAGLDPDKLLSFQSHWMGQLPLEAKVEQCLPYLVKAKLVSDPPDERSRTLAGKVAAALGDRLKTFSDILDAADFFVPDDQLTYDEAAFSKRLRAAGSADRLARIRRLLSEIEPFTSDVLEESLRKFVEAENIKMADVVHSLRVAITGKSIGPGLFDCLSILGRDSSLARIDRALARVDAEEQTVQSRESE